MRRKQEIKMGRARKRVEVRKNKLYAGKVEVYRITNTFKDGQRWERLIARPSGCTPRKIKKARGRKKEG